MHILHLIGSMDPSTGGPCQGIRNSSPILEEIDVHREIVCFDPPDSSYLSTDIFPVYALGGTKNAWAYSPLLIPWLQANIHRFDTIITNGLWLYHSYATRKVLDWYRRTQPSAKPIQWFIMPHGMLDPYFQRASSRKLKALRNWLYWKLIEHKIISDADGMLFTCETELLLARETFKPYKPKREINVGYGIQAPPPFTPLMQARFLEACPALNGQPYFLFLSRINYKKGVDLLIKAYSSLLNNASTDQRIPKLVIAGPGVDDPYGEQMKRLIAQTPSLATVIFFPGMLTGDAKWGALYGCEAFVLPSHQENFGIAVAEALACGKPVLISDQVNIWREIKAGGCGLVAEDTLTGTEELLRQWLSLTRVEKEIMSKNAMATYLKHFSIEPAAIKFKEAIQTNMD